MKDVDDGRKVIQGSADAYLEGLYANKHWGGAREHNRELFMQTQDVGKKPD